jgi:hypothetical protein
LSILVLNTSRRFVCAHAGPLLVPVWRGHVTLASLPIVRELAADLIARYGRVSTLSIMRIARSTPALEPGVEPAYAELAAELSPGLVGAATVIEASGTAAAIAHGVRARTLPVLAAPSEAFSTVTAALAWLAALPGQAEELRSAASLAVELELLGRGDEEEGGAEVVPFPRGRRAG